MSLPQSVYFCISNFWDKLTLPNVYSIQYCYQIRKYMIQQIMPRWAFNPLVAQTRSFLNRRAFAPFLGPMVPNLPSAPDPAPRAKVDYEFVPQVCTPTKQALCTSNFGFKWFVSLFLLLGGSRSLQTPAPSPFKNGRLRLHNTGYRTVPQFPILEWAVIVYAWGVWKLKTRTMFVNIVCMLSPPGDS